MALQFNQTHYHIYDAVIDCVDNVKWKKIDKKTKDAIIRTCKAQIAPLPYILLNDIASFSNVQGNYITEVKLWQVRHSTLSKIVVVLSDSQYWGSDADTLHFGYAEYSNAKNIASWWKNNTSANIYILDISRCTPTLFKYREKDDVHMINAHHYKTDTALINRIRKLADIWSSVLDYRFNMPLHNNAENFQRKKENVTYTAFKLNADTFNQKHSSVSETELLSFYSFYKFCKKHGINKFVNPDTIYCPTCGRPMLKTTQYCRCCGWENPAYYPCNLYYEDTNSDFEVEEEDY